MKKMLGAIFLLVIWQMGAMVAKSKLLPRPWDVLLSLQKNWQPLAIHTAYSLMRLCIGVVLALLIGTAIGLLMGYFDQADQLLSPALYLLSPIPKVALLPLIMLLFGIGNLSKIFIIFIIMVFQVIIAARDSVHAISEEVFMPLRAAKASTWQLFRYVILPASVPALLTALRIGLSTSISVLFFAETFGTTWGLGFYIMDMWMRLDYQQMYLGIAMLGAVGLCCVAAVDGAQKKLCRWRVQ